jgi:uncharacterized protein (DUF1810 family)
VRAVIENRFDLARFVEAQQGVYDAVLSELRAGRKRSHWMWFIFPQIRGLGHSSTAQLYAISGLDEAVAFLDHPILGRRLRECTTLVNALSSSSAREVFGSPDDLKFRSSMTLFAHAAIDNAVFLQALEKYFGSALDPLTLQRL